ncbi:O-acetyl-ADP-ribose deacetylase [Streptomyces sp. F-1]|nr:O-acetyl-ADP-ribose deacetylase [Streptomyces sp. F-1]
MDGAIHRRGGPAILAECRALRASRYGRGLPTGQAVATTAGQLDARWVIHTVGPVYEGPDSDPAPLASCYRESLRAADEPGARTVAFPAPRCPAPSTDHCGLTRARGRRIVGHEEHRNGSRRNLLVGR